MNDKDLMMNASGCQDPTAYAAVKNIQGDEARVTRLLKTIFYICELAGFDIQNRIVFVDKKTGQIWR